jgi:hypothetical protein
MRRVFIVTTAIAILVVAPASAQLIGQPSGQGGAPPPPPNVSTVLPTAPSTTGGITQFQESTLPLEGSSAESSSGTSPYSPSPRVRALNQLTRPQVGGADRPAGPLR